MSTGRCSGRQIRWRDAVTETQRGNGYVKDHGKHYVFFSTKHEKVYEVYWFPAEMDEAQNQLELLIKGLLFKIDDCNERKSRHKENN